MYICPLSHVAPFAPRLHLTCTLCYLSHDERLVPCCIQHVHLSSVSLCTIRPQLNVTCTLCSLSHDARLVSCCIQHVYLSSVSWCTISPLLHSTCTFVLCFMMYDLSLVASDMYAFPLSHDERFVPSCIQHVHLSSVSWCSISPQLNVTCTLCSLSHDERFVPSCIQHVHLSSVSWCSISPLLHPTCTLCPLSHDAHLFLVASNMYTLWPVSWRNNHPQLHPPITSSVSLCTIRPLLHPTCSLCPLSHLSPLHLLSSTAGSTQFYNLQLLHIIFSFCSVCREHG